MKKRIAILLLCLVMFLFSGNTIAATSFISRLKSKLMKGNLFTGCTNVALHTKDDRVAGYYTITLIKDELKEYNRNITVRLTVQNITDCKLLFDGYFETGGWYIKTVSWGAGQEINPGESKASTGTMSVKKDMSESSLTFEPQGWLLDCPDQKQTAAITYMDAEGGGENLDDVIDKFNLAINDLANQHDQDMRKQREREWKLSQQRKSEEKARQGWEAQKLADEHRKQELQQKQVRKQIRQKDFVAGRGLTRDSSGIIYDPQTGLEWYVSDDCTLNWKAAKEYVASLRIGGGGWRMATISELAELDRHKGNFEWDPKYPGSVTGSKAKEGYCSYSFETHKEYCGDGKGMNCVFAVRSRR